LCDDKSNKERDNTLEDRAANQPVGQIRCVIRLKLLRFLAGLLAIALPRKGFFHAALLARLQIKGMAFHFLDDVFLLNLPLEAAQSVFKGLALLNSNLCQKKYTSRHPCMGNPDDKASAAQNALKKREIPR